MTSNALDSSHEFEGQTVTELDHEYQKIKISKTAVRDVSADKEIVERDACQRRS